MADQTFNGDMVVRGTLVPTRLVVPVACVKSASIEPGSNLDADNLESRFCASHAQPNSAATTETRTLFVARRAGTINEIIAGSIAAAIGDSTATIDVKKNGTTVLSSAIVLDNSNTARTPEVGTISGDGIFAAGDWFEVVITISAGTGTLPTGVFVQIECDQNGV